MKIFIITLTIMAISIVTNAQDKYCDQKLSEKLTDLSKDMNDATYLKDFYCYLPKATVVKMPEQRYSIVFTDSTIYRLALVCSEKFQGNATLSITGNSTLPILKNGEPFTSLICLRGSSPVIFDFEVPKTGIYHITISNKDGYETCAAFCLYFVRKSGTSSDSRKDWVRIMGEKMNIEYYSDKDTMCYTSVDLNATFQGSDINAFRSYIGKYLKVTNNITSNPPLKPAIIEFRVTCDGEIKNVKVARSSGNVQFDNEVVKAIQSSPKWEPAKVGNKKVGQIFVLPVKYSSSK